MPERLFQRARCNAQPCGSSIVVSPRCAELRLPSAPAQSPLAPLSTTQPEWMTTVRGDTAEGPQTDDSTLLVTIPADKEPSFVYCGRTQSTVSSDGVATVLRSNNGLSFDSSTTAASNPFIRVEKVGQPDNGQQQYRVTFLQPVPGQDTSGALDRDALVMRVDGRDIAVRPAPRPSPVAPLVPPSDTPIPVPVPPPVTVPEPSGPTGDPNPTPVLAPEPAPLAPPPRAREAAPPLPDGAAGLYNPQNPPAFVAVPERFSGKINATVGSLTDGGKLFVVSNNPSALHVMELQRVNNDLFIVTTHHTVTNPAGGSSTVDTAFLRRTGNGWEIAAVTGRGTTAEPIAAERMSGALNGNLNGLADWTTRFDWMSDPNQTRTTTQPATAPRPQPNFPEAVVNANGAGASIFHPAVQPTFFPVPATDRDQQPNQLSQQLDQIVERTRSGNGVFYLSNDNPGARHTMEVRNINGMLVITTYHTPTAPGSRQLVDSAVFVKTASGWQVASLEGSGANAQPIADDVARANFSGRPGAPVGGMWATRLSWLSASDQPLRPERPDLRPPTFPRP